MASPKYKLTINDNEHVENSYFKMPTITVEEMNDETEKSQVSSTIKTDEEVSTPSGDAEENRKKELDRIKKWIEDRRKSMEANKGSEPKEQTEEEEDKPRAKIELPRVEERKYDRTEEQKEIETQRKLIEERRKKMEEMIAKMRQAADKEKETEDREELPGVDQAHMLRKKVQEKVEVEMPDKVENEMKEEIKEELKEYERREENVGNTIIDDMKEFIKAAALPNENREDRNKIINGLKETLPPTKKEVHNIFAQLNNLKK